MQALNKAVSAPPVIRLGLLHQHTPTRLVIRSRGTTVGS